MTEFKIHDGDLKVQVEITEEKKNAIVARILKFCKEYNCISGETLQQSDRCIIEAPEVLSDIIDDIMDFKEEYVG